MSAQDLEVIDHTVQLTHEWVNELRERLGWPSSRDAMRLMRTVLSELRDRLPHAEVADLAAQMPLLIRGMYYEGWQPARTPVHDRSADAFEAAVAARLGRVEGYRGHADIAAVFATLANRMTEGELRQARAALPRGVRDLWDADLTWTGG
ncbi:DUF2267 domain-containing protein [Jannaschia sp. Os4]|nr:DUF2267 domain-containing protein [Jannaschia sp. Os4]